MLRARVDRQRCIGAGTCITLAPTAFDWLKGEFLKADVVDTGSVDEEQLREAAFSCPTAAIIIEEVEELLPWQLRSSGVKAPRRIMATFMFTDIVNSTNLIEAIGDEAWESVLRWHNEALRGLFNAHRGDEIDNPGDGFFVSFESPDAALACAVAIQRKLTEHRQTAGFAPQIRIGVHASSASVVGKSLARGDPRERGDGNRHRIYGVVAEDTDAERDLRTDGRRAGRLEVATRRSVSLKGAGDPTRTMG